MVGIQCRVVQWFGNEARPHTKSVYESAKGEQCAQHRFPSYLTLWSELLFVVIKFNFGVAFIPSPLNCTNKRRGSKRRRKKERKKRGQNMPYILTVLVLVVAVVAYRLRHVGSRPKNLPPGPPTLPFIGNLHLMPFKDPHHQFKQWAEEYG